MIVGMVLGVFSCAKTRDPRPSVSFQSCGTSTARKIESPANSLISSMDEKMPWMLLRGVPSSRLMCSEARLSSAPSRSKSAPSLSGMKKRISMEYIREIASMPVNVSTCAVTGRMSDTRVKTSGAALTKTPQVGL